MICPVCFRTLRGQSKRHKGSFGLHIPHQETANDLEGSAKMECCICWSLWNEWGKIKQEEDRLVSEVMHSKHGFTNAHLSKIPERNGFYRLDFKTSVGSRRLGTFLLQPTASEFHSAINTPLGAGTESEESLRLARFWIDNCLSDAHPNCPNEHFSNRNLLYSTAKPIRDFELLTQNYDRKDNIPKESQFYPTRLIQLPPKDTSGSDTWKFQNVKLVETRNCADEEVHVPNGRYITLSHCWGVNSTPFCLSTHNLRACKTDGISLESLPRSFQHAIHFGSKLNPDIRYVWIDSLCIIQNSDEDWRHEALQMFEIYRNSYCNISATFAENGSKGMYAPHNLHHLWEDEISLPVDTISSTNSTSLSRPANLRHNSSSFMLPYHTTSQSSQLASMTGSVNNGGNPTWPLAKRFSIIDLSFWDLKVDLAPVNRRAWVLQERLLAPRVLHFCDDQLAWECRHMDASETFPLGICGLELRGGRVRERIRLKALTPDYYGPVARGVSSRRLSSIAHESWKRVVERYSITGLSKSRDKLIALAGIAQLMGNQIGGIYVAGMWEVYLASQLLWRVESEFRNDRFEYNSGRPTDQSGKTSWRAPSFSWASVDAPAGIRCGETKMEGEMFLSVDEIHVTPQDIEKPYGPIKSDCFIFLTCSLTKVIISREVQRARDESRNFYTLYVWDFPSDLAPDQQGPQQRPKMVAPLVYLDSPKDDYENIKGDNGEIYCMPASRDADDYLICLLLQKIAQGLQGSDTYRRIGLTVIQASSRSVQQKISDVMTERKTIKVV